MKYETQINVVGAEFGLEALCARNQGISLGLRTLRLRELSLIFHLTKTMAETKTSTPNNDFDVNGVNWAEISLPSPIRRSVADVPREPLPRECASCRCQFPWDGIAYKTVCDNCYRTKTRSCAICHIGTIRASAPAFHTVCTSCYVDSKRSKCYSPCPTCPPERSHHLRRPPGKDHCPECDAIFASRATIGR